MNKNSYWALPCLLGLLACQPSEIDQMPVPKEKIPVHFSLCLSEEVLPFPVTRAMPDSGMPEPVAVKSGIKQVEDVCSALEYVVFNVAHPEDTLRHRCFRQGDNDFGIVYDSLPAGDYRIAFLAHSSVCTAQSDSVMAFNGLSDTFWCCETISIADTIKRDFVLSRIVGKIEFASTEPVPAYVERFDAEISNHFGKLNILTGRGVAPEKMTLSHTFTAQEKGMAGMKHAFLTFISSDGLSQSGILSSFDTNNVSMRRHEVKDINPVANRLIRYSGLLYSKPLSNDTFSLVIDGSDWEEENRVLSN